MTRVEQFLNFLDKVDEEVGIGLGIDYDDINENNIDSLKSEFIQKFTIEHDFNDILNQLNENEDKSLLEELNEI